MRNKVKIVWVVILILSSIVIISSLLSDFVNNKNPSWYLVFSGWIIVLLRQVVELLKELSND